MNSPIVIPGRAVPPISFVPASASYRKWESHYALPDPRELDALGETIVYAFVPFDSQDMTGGNIAAGVTAYGGMTQEDDCWVYALTGSSINPSSPGTSGNFTVQFYDTERQKLFQTQPILFANGLGSAQKPFWLRKPYKLPRNGQIKTAVVNLATFAAAIQVVMWGLRKDTWKAVS